MFNRVPAEFGKKRILIKDIGNLYKFINFYNGKSECFMNTYHCKNTFIDHDDYDREKLDRKSIVIDRIPFDLDKEKSYQDMYKLHCYCEERNIKHTVIFSGNGYHVYIHVSINSINTILDVLMEQNNLIKKLDLDVDPTIIGNPSHMIRIPGTYNKRRGRYCICLNYNELELGHEKIKEIAKSQRKGITFICDNLFELQHYKSSDVDIFTSYTGELKDIDLDIDLLIPCLTINIRTGGYLPHNERVWIAQYLSDLYRKGKHNCRLLVSDKNCSG